MLVSCRVYIVCCVERMCFTQTTCISSFYWFPSTLPLEIDHIGLKMVKAIFFQAVYYGMSLVDYGVMVPPFWYDWNPICLECIFETRKYLTKTQHPFHFEEKIQSYLVQSCSKKMSTKTTQTSRTTQTGQRQIFARKSACSVVVVVVVVAVVAVVAVVVVVVVVELVGGFHFFYVHPYLGK